MILFRLICVHASVAVAGEGWLDWLKLKQQLRWSEPFFPCICLSLLDVWYILSARLLP